MFSLKALFQAVQHWREGRGVRRAPKRARVDIEPLDHRRLLSVTFSGNVANDFPATSSPGVAVISFPRSDLPQIPVPLQPVIPVSGFGITDLRLSYDSTTDTMYVGLEGPPANGVSGPQVIAGDADANGNSGTVNPAVTAIDPGFQDPPDMQGSEFMGSFFAFNTGGVPTIVAGIAPEMPGYTKNYTVAQAIPNPVFPTTQPTFGTPLPGNTGNVYLVNDPNHPNFEFAISHFSQLYQQDTGQALTPNTVLGVGAFGGSGQDGGISKQFSKAVDFTFGQTIEPLPPPCIQSPLIRINPHSANHINTAHPDLIRVNVFGTSGFNVNSIIPSSVSLGGAHPIFYFKRRINKDAFPDETFVFRGTDVILPRGITNATLTGNLTNGDVLQSTVQVFNRNYSFYGSLRKKVQERRLERVGITPAIYTGGSNDAAAPIQLKPPAFGLAFAKRQALKQSGATPALEIAAPAAATPKPLTVKLGERRLAAEVKVSRRAEATLQARTPHFAGSALARKNRVASVLASALSGGGA